MTLMSETFFALYPLYAFTPPTLGGLGLSEAEIGADMAFRAALIIVLLIISTPIQRRFGALRTYQAGMVMWPASVVFLPILNRMVRTDSYGSGTLAYRFVFGLFYLTWAIGALVWRKSWLSVFSLDSTAVDGFVLASSQLIIADASPAPNALATVTVSSLYVVYDISRID